MIITGDLPHVRQSPLKKEAMAIESGYLVHTLFLAGEEACRRLDAVL